MNVHICNKQTIISYIKLGQGGEGNANSGVAKRTSSWRVGVYVSERVGRITSGTSALGHQEIKLCIMSYGAQHILLNGFAEPQLAHPRMRVNLHLYYY